VSGVLERSSRIAVIVSAAAALALETRFAAKTWEPFAWSTPLAFAGAFVLARWSPRAVYAAVLGVAYVVPVMFQAALGRFYLTDQVIWLAALLGMVSAQADWRRWSVPDSWKLPLAYWALVLAVAWPVLIAREADFHWATMAGVVHIPNNGVSTPPPAIAVMILNVTLTYLVGILLFDLFFRAFDRGAGVSFRRVVVLPLVVSFLFCAAVSLYQMFVNIAWLSAHQWPVIGRAAGGLLDGDASGALAGFWIAPAWAFGSLTAGGLGAAGVLAAIAWAVVWGSGSRMALTAAVIATLGVAAAGARIRRARAVLVVFVVVCAAAALLVFRLGLGSIDDPLHRALGSLPTLTRESLVEFAKIELFDRHAPYGTASMAMVKQLPVTGVGAGNFYSLFPDYAFGLVGERFHIDNAQSWYRHQVAELGIVGSVGWIWWLGAFGWMLVTTRGDAQTRFQAGALKSALVAIAVVSLVSMPTQVIPVSLTVWVFAFWYVSVARAAPASPRWRQWVDGPIPWTAVWLLVIVFAADTYRVARAELRPPYRALSFDWDYHRGWHRLETADHGGPFRWMAEDEAVAVFPAAGRYLKLTFWINHPDAARHPVDVSVSGSEGALGSVALHDSTPVTWYVRVPPHEVAPAGHLRMMIETRVSRMWIPARDGVPDPRQLGAAVADWTFVDQPPAGAHVIN
jgi:hypothetical protein